MSDTEEVAEQLQTGRTTNPLDSTLKAYGKSKANNLLAATQTAVDIDDSRKEKVFAKSGLFDVIRTSQLQTIALVDPRSYLTQRLSELEKVKNKSIKHYEEEYNDLISKGYNVVQAKEEALRRMKQYTLIQMEGVNKLYPTSSTSTAIDTLTTTNKASV
jgi:hypothetical protein